FEERAFPSLILFSLLSLGATPAHPEVVRWLHVPKGAGGDPTLGALAVDCGDLGRYELIAGVEEPPPGLSRAAWGDGAGSGSGGCEKCTSGLEAPPVYPPPWFGEPPLEKMAAFSSAMAEGPCAEGSCLSDPKSDRTWIAVVDWADPHGWSVAATIRTLAPPELDVWLEPVRPKDSRELDPFSPRGVTDVHVLAALCRIESLAARGLAPLAVNLSFGRWIKGVEEGSLAAEIERVIDQLAGRGIPVLAAAGNYQLLQFPAASRGALPVGVLDLAAFRYGKVKRTWETPILEGRPTRALVPVSGLCLPMDGRPSWPAPPGSSYATAGLTGLLAQHLAADPALGEQLKAGRFWWLDADCSLDHCEMALRSDLSQSLTVSADTAVALFGPLFQGVRPDCSGPEREESLRVGVGPVTPIDPELLSRAEIYPAFKRPSPDSNPCVPCMGAGGPRQAQRVASGLGDEALSVDLSAAEPLPAGATIDAVQLRLGAAVYPLSLRPETLDQLARGEIPRLTLYDVPWEQVRPTSLQLSLRFIISEWGAPLPYWVSVPLRMLEPRK
ncbi:MAG TPA: S8/S53 family peptidase, partial [Thermoanaerobaculia bacterium]|nr:S8/S53 family peptidase [Thermoanaerobaculia bacterium]